MLLLIFCLAIAYAIQGAVTQAWTDGRAGAQAAGTRAVSTGKARAAGIRTTGSRPARAALWVGTGIGSLLYGIGVLGWGTGKALWTGGRDGWRAGWEKGRARADARQKDRQAVADGRHDDPSPPRWRNWITGECPWCHHPPQADTAETGGCGCENLDWGCPCARRNHAAPPPVWDDPTPQAIPVPDLDDTPPTPAGGDGTAASDNLDDPEPTDPNPTPPAHEEAPMPVTTSEPVGYAGTCRALEEIGAAATTYLDTAAQARTEAEELRRLAEQMQASMSARDMDPASLAAVASLMEQAARLERAADDLASAADGTRAAASTALDAVQTHAGVAEAVQSHEHAADKEFYTEGR